jgi:1-deoxy-D-xylulose-5-phosphate reductoisomerase
MTDAINMPQHLAILGQPAASGVSTLDVVARHRGRFNVVALSAYRQLDLLLHQCLQFAPRFAVLHAAEDAARLQRSLQAQGSATEVLHGARGPRTDCRFAASRYGNGAIVGIAGLRATFAAVKAGKRVLLAK